MTHFFDLVGNYLSALQSMSEVTLTVRQPQGWLTLLANFCYLSHSRQSLLNSMEVQISPHTHIKKEQSSSKSKAFA